MHILKLSLLVLNFTEYVIGKYGNNRAYK